MAASSLNVVRVRLHFDYPPPAISTCRMCWLLIDLNKCRVVADLVSVIRKKFDYSRKTCLDLFIEDCYLPPSESIYVVRDNDSIRVKAEGLSIKNGTESDAPKSSRVKKRRRETLEQEVPDEQTNIRALKKKKQAEESPATQQNVTQDVKKKKKSKKRKRNEEHASERQTDSAKHNPVASVTKPQLEKSSKRQQPSASALNGKPVDGKPKETSSDSSDSSEEEPSKRLAQHPKPQKKGSSSVGPVSKPGNAAKRRDNSSSSDSDSDTDSTLFQPPPKKPTPAKSLPAKSKPSPQKAAVSSKPKQPPSKQQAQSSSSDSDSDSSSSAEMPPPKRIPPVPSSNPKTSPSTVSAAAGGFKKPTAKTVETSSDTDDSSSSSERPPVKKPSAPCPPKAPVSVPCTPKTPSAPSSAAPAAKPAVGTSAKPAPSTSESDISEEEIELVIRKPVLNGMGLSVAGVVSSSPIVGAGRGRAEGKSPGRGIGRGDGRFARRGSISRERGRGGGRGNGTPWNKGSRYDYSDEDQNKKRWVNDSLTNTSLILQNPPEPAPPRDYSGFPLLAAPPAVGQKIAFKLLELTANYSPEVSDYKEGKITGLNVTTNMVELELLSAPKVPVEPGRFDLVYEKPDSSEVVEYAVTQGSQLTERWDTLLEPRLIVDNVG